MATFIYRFFFAMLMVFVCIGAYVFWHFIQFLAGGQVDQAHALVDPMIHLGITQIFMLIGVVWGEYLLHRQKFD
jgi:predicted cation transporter